MPVVEYGSKLIPVKAVTLSLRDQNAPPLRQGPPGRSDRQGVRQYKIQSLHKGLGIIHGSEQNDTLRLRSSTGVVTHQKFGAFLPYAYNTQTSISGGANMSGFRAANLRATSVNSTLGQSKQRFYLSVGKKLFRTSSDSVFTLADTSLSMTDNILHMFEGKFNSTRYLVLCTDNTTDDCTGLADPSGSPTSKTSLFVGSSRVDLQACKLEYSIVSPK